MLDMSTIHAHLNMHIIFRSQRMTSVVCVVVTIRVASSRAVQLLFPAMAYNWRWNTIQDIDTSNLGVFLPTASVNAFQPPPRPSASCVLNSRSHQLYATSCSFDVYRGCTRSSDRQTTERPPPVCSSPALYVAFKSLNRCSSLSMIGCLLSHFWHQYHVSRLHHSLSPEMHLMDTTSS
jgi:hypothetical protein